MSEKRSGFRGFIDRFKAVADSSKVEIKLEEGEEIDLNQVRISRARAVLADANLRPREREALAQLEEGVRTLSHHQTVLAAELALSLDPKFGVDEADLPAFRDAQEAYYERTKEIVVTPSMLDGLEGRRDL